MRIGLDGDPSGLPPAFKKFEEEVSKLRVLAKGAEEAVNDWLARIGVSASGESSAKHEGLLQEREAQRRLAINTFVHIYTNEAARGNFEVLQAADIMGMLGIEGPNVMFSKSRSRFKAIEILYEAQKNEPEQLLDILECFPELLSSQLSANIWKRLKHFQGDSLAVQTDYFRTYGFNSATVKLFWLVNADEETLSDATKSLMRHRVMSAPQGNVDFILSNRSRNFEKLVRLDAAPFFVRGLNPSFYEEELVKNHIDPKVADVLINSWEEDFTSFLRAAKTLSSESA